MTTMIRKNPSAILDAPIESSAPARPGAPHLRPLLWLEGSYFGVTGVWPIRAVNLRLPRHLGTIACMKNLLLTFSFFLGTLAHGMDAFPTGEYVGTGVKSFPDGKTKSYAVSMKIQADRIAFRYEFTGGSPIDFELRMTWEKNGFFRIGSIGSGYCGAKSCHWQVSLGEHGTEEWTLFFDGKRLEKVGSLTNEGSKNFWEESLTLK